jgi:hypothetical protein
MYFTLNLVNIPVTFLPKWSINCHFSKEKLQKTFARRLGLHFAFYKNTLTEVAYFSLTARCFGNLICFFLVSHLPSSPVLFS